MNVFRVVVRSVVLRVSLSSLPDEAVSARPRPRDDEVGCGRKVMGGGLK
jgi:hypothetical protein